MGIELTITEELGNLCVTATELAAIARLINTEIKNSDFSGLFNELIVTVAKSYDVVDEHLQTFSRLDTESAFVAEFDTYHAAYTACYLKEVSRPRSYADEAYEKYLVLQTRRECKTQYPLLKRTFTRLDQFIDKWVTNDAWLAMSIDNLLKMLQRLLNEIAEFKQKDPADAFLIHHAAFTGFATYLALLRQHREQLQLPMAA